MKKISIVVQGDEAISNRQRVVINPERFRSVPELLQVLSMELKQVDGSPLILPPSTQVAILQSSTGTFVPLVDVRHVEDSSRLQIQCTGSKKGGKRFSADGNSVAAGGGGDGSRAAGVEKGTELFDVLLYHCKIVAYLSANLPADREITVQDIQAVVEDPQAKARQLMDQLVASRVDAVSSAKILTQLALQRGKSDREQSDGSATVEMRKTLSAYQNRIDRLEAELEKATSLYDTTQARLDAVLAEREKSTTGLNSVIAACNSENLVRAEEVLFLRTCADNFQKDMSDMLVAPDVGQRFKLAPSSSDGTKKLQSKKTTTSEMPSSLNEEKYLRIIDPDRPARQSLQLASIAENIDRLTMERPSTTGTMLQRPALTQFGSPPLTVNVSSSPSSVCSEEICVHCNLLLLSGAGRTEPIFVSPRKATFPKFVEQFLAAFATDIESGSSGNRSEFEFSYFRNGSRHTIKTSEELSAFLSGGRPTHDGRPRSVAVNCVEVNRAVLHPEPSSGMPASTANASISTDPARLNGFSSSPVSAAPASATVLATPLSGKSTAARFFGKDTNKSGQPNQSRQLMENSTASFGDGSPAADVQSNFGTRPKTSDALSTRSFFLSVGPIPVPSDSTIRDIFASMIEGGWTSTGDRDLSSTKVPKKRVVQYLSSKYETYGDSSRFSKILDQTCPVEASITLDQFSLVLLRVIRE
jgi:hypothetical protein